MNEILENKISDNPEVIQKVNEEDYANAAHSLLRFQQTEWEQCNKGYETLSSVKNREFQFEGFKIKAQFNSGRIKSSSAKVDKESINNRECFLCLEKLPEEQKGIFFDNRYLILCNPYPIFDEHFTLNCISHIPQNIDVSFNSLLKFSKELGKNYTVFYNGPKCGASAPDHLHFQAGSKFFLPINDDFHQLKNEYGKVIFEDEELTVTGVNDNLRKFITFESNNKDKLKTFFEELLGILKFADKDNKEEPLINILSFYDKDFGWRVIVFLRSKHRPDHYYFNDEKRILISPAAVDLGGVCILPIEEDFNKLTKEIITEIFKDVFIGKEHYEYIISKFPP